LTQPFVRTGLPKPRPDDSLFLRLRDSKKDVLTRRFDAIRGRLIDRLGDLMEARRKMENSALAAEADGVVGIQVIGIGDQVEA
jgi:hypothetical protein